MNYLLLFVFLLLFFCSCGTKKKHGEQLFRSYQLRDSSLLRGTVNRGVSEQLLSRTIQLSPPDSSGKQVVVSVTETHLVRSEVDSIFIARDTKIMKEETVDYAMQETRESPPFAMARPLVWLCLAVLIAFLIFRS